MGNVSKLNGKNIKDKYSREQLALLGEKMVQVLADVGILQEANDTKDASIAELQKVTTALSQNLSATDENVNALTNEVASVSTVANEAKNIALGRNQSLALEDGAELVNTLNNASETSYQRGQNIYIAKLDVPDVWVYEVCDTFQYYDYLSESDFWEDLESAQTLQIGYYKVAALETQKVDLGGYVTQGELASTWDEVNGKVDVSDFVVIEGKMDFDLEDYTQGTYTYEIPSSNLPSKLQGGNKLDNYAVISSMFSDGGELIAMSSYDGNSHASMSPNYSVSLVTTALGAGEECIRIKLRDLQYGSGGIVFIISYKIVLMKIS